MMDPFSTALAAIKAAGLPAPTYRTARELLDLAAENGQLKIGKAALRDLCGTTKDETVRGHLWQLQSAGIIHWSTNEVVHISFTAWPPVDPALVQPTLTRDVPTLARATPTATPAPGPDKKGSALVQPTLTRDVPTLARDTPTPPHTREVSLLVSSSPTQNAEQTNKPTAPGPKRQPWESPLSFQLLTDKRVAMSPRIAERLAAAHPYWEVRDAVAHWFCGRRSAGGRFEETPGIVITWLDNPDEYVIPTLSEEFRQTGLYRDHRTPDELAAEQAALDEAQRQEEQDLAEQAEEAPAAAAPDPPHQPEEGTPAWAWMQVQRELAIEQGGTFDRWVNDTRLVEHDPDTNTFTIALPDAFRYDWIVNRLSKQINRKLAVITRQPSAQTKFIVDPGPFPGKHNKETADERQ